MVVLDEGIKEERKTKKEKPNRFEIENVHNFIFVLKMKLTERWYASMYEPLGASFVWIDDSHTHTHTQT